LAAPATAIDKENVVVADIVAEVECKRVRARALPYRDEGPHCAIQYSRSLRIFLEIFLYTKFGVVGVVEGAVMIANWILPVGFGEEPRELIDGLAGEVEYQLEHVSVRRVGEYLGKGVLRVLVLASFLEDVGACASAHDTD